MKIGIDLDDVMAICSVPYLRRFAQEFNVELPDESQIGWHLLSQKESGAAYDTVVPGLERVVAAEHELYFITARAERRRYITETWLREKGIFDHAKAVHLKPIGDFRPEYPRGRYDPAGSADYKVRLAKELELDAFCEDDVVISQTLAKAGF